MKRDDIEVAVAAALSLVLPLYLIMKWEAETYGTGPFPGSSDALLLALVGGAYLAPALLVDPLKKPRLARRLPVCVWVSAFGSLLIFPAVMLHSVLMDPGGQVKGFDWGAALWLFLGLSIYTLLFGAVVEYSGSLASRVRRWHEGAGSYFSISAK